MKKKEYSLKEVNNSLFYSIIEYLILRKLPFFKNNPRANYLILRAFLITLTISSFWLFFFIYDVFGDSKCLFSPEIDQKKLNIYKDKIGTYATLFLSCLGIIYWKLKEELYSKWKYLMDITVKINEIELSKNESNVKLAELLNNPNFYKNAKLRKYWNLRFCLVMDSITLDLWMHRSFKDLYKTLVEKSIENIYQNDDNEIKEKKNSFKKGELTQNDVYEILDEVYGKI